MQLTKPILHRRYRARFRTVWQSQSPRNLLESRSFMPCIFKENSMGGLIYLVGLIVIVMFILSFLGLR